MAKKKSVRITYTVTVDISLANWAAEYGMEGAGEQELIADIIQGYTSKEALKVLKNALGWMYAVTTSTPEVTAKTKVRETL